MTNATKDLISNVDKLNEHFNVQLQHQKTAFFSDKYVCRNCHIMVSNVSRTIMYVVCCNNGSTTEFH